MSNTIKISALRLTAEKKIEKREEFVPIERRLRILVNGELIANLAMSPSLEKEAAIGYLLGEGYVKTLEEIEKMELNGDDIRITTTKTSDFEIQKEFILTTDCTGGWRAKLSSQAPNIMSNYKFSPEIAFKMLKEFQERSKGWKITGGVHAAMLVTAKGKVVAFTEDVSRYVAIDKVIGIAALNKVDFEKCMLVSSGRLPADMVLKAARVGIPLVISRTAPLDSGIEAAQKTGLTLIGFARGNRMNIYSHSERVLD